VAFDPFSAVETSAEMTLEMLLHPQRVSRLIAYKSLDDSQLGFDELLEELMANSIKKTHKDPYYQELQNIINSKVLEQLFYLSSHKNQYPQVNAMVDAALNEIKSYLKDLKSTGIQKMYDKAMIEQLSNFEKNPTSFKKSAAPKIPDGSPIGTTH
jgi:hypothetical protein